MSETASGWRTPTIIILCGCLISVLMFGVRSGFGLFLAPMSEAGGWGREVFALAMAIQNIVWGAASPFTSALADRYGTGRVLAIGGVFYAGGTMLMAFSSDPWLLHVSAGAMVGFGLAGASYAIILGAIARSVPPEKRSWALGLGTAAGSLGQFLLAPLGQALIAVFDWQMALILLGGLALLVIPLSSALAGKSEAIPGAIGAATLKEALGEAFRSSSYWLLIAGFFVCGFHVAFIATHLPPFLTDNRVPDWVAGWSLALVGLFNVVGSYSAGVLGGKYSKKWLLTWLYLARGLVIAVYILLPITTTTTLLFAAGMGLLWLSTVPLTSGLVMLMFGPRFMATLFGIVFFSHQIGAFLGVWLGGRLYDVTGSYDIVWWLGVVLGVAAGLVHLPLRERPVSALAPAQ